MNDLIQVIVIGFSAGIVAGGLMAVITHAIATTLNIFKTIL